MGDHGKFAFKAASKPSGAFKDAFKREFSWLRTDDPVLELLERLDVDRRGALPRKLLLKLLKTVMPEMSESSIEQPLD